jgi:four helix bundle protein
VCANLSEAWRRRRYQAAFINNLNHVEAEAAETQVWLSFSKECGYLSDQESNELIQAYNPIIGITIQMIKHPENWIINHKTSRKK